MAVLFRQPAGYITLGGKVRARVLLTDGVRTVDLLWIMHDGKDVYCGMPKSDFKRSYHESGKIHTMSNGQRSDEHWIAPLAELKGQFNLGSLGIGPPAKVLEVMDKRYDYSGKQSDAVLVVDSRSIPEGHSVNVGYGLLEPENVSALLPFMRTHVVPDFATISCEQLLLATSVKPWVYVVLHWWKDAA